MNAIESSPSKKSLATNINEAVANFLRWAQRPIAFLAFLYGGIAIYRFATGALNAANGVRPPEAIAHILIWTFAPPLWFAYEYSFVFRTTEERQAGKTYQELTAKIWGAVLAAILLLAGK